MRWAIVLAVSLSLLAGCDKKVYHSPVAVPSGPQVEGDWQPPPVVRPIIRVVASPDRSEQMAEHIAIREELRDVVVDLRKAASKLDQVDKHGPPVGGGGGGSSFTPMKPKGKSKPLVKTKIQRKETRDNVDAIQTILIDSKEQVEKLDQMTSQELRKKIRELKRGQR